MTQPLLFAVNDGGLLVGDEAEASLPIVADIPGLETFDVGRLGDRVCLAAEVATVPSGWRREPLRRLHGPLGEQAWTMAGRAVQLLHFDATHRFCGRCGGPTLRSTVEHARKCGSCGLEAHPRLSPAVIVRIEREGEILLARGARHPPGTYSLPAGFVEPGETLEEAAAREVREEVGLELTDLAYLRSQPWPFPHSLMVGLGARWAGGEPKADGVEILEAGWFRPDALPDLPPPVSIARRLIDDWLRGGGPERADRIPS